MRAGGDGAMWVAWMAYGLKRGVPTLRGPDSRSVSPPPPPESDRSVVRFPVARKWAALLAGLSRCLGVPGARRPPAAARRALQAAGLLAALALALPASAGAKDYGCLESSFASCLQDGRFKVRAYYDHEEAQNRSAKVRDAFVGDAASLFYFFTFDNPELMVKVVDGCVLNGRYWVFGSAATDLDYAVTVEDRATGRQKRYERNRSNPLIGDVVSFPCRIPESAAVKAFGKKRSGGAAGFHAEPAHADAGPLRPDLRLCGGAVVPDGLPVLAAEASRRGASPVALRRASSDRLHVIDIAFIFPDTITDKATLRRNVDDAVAVANVIFLRSGVPAALRTVAVQPDRRYGISLDGLGLLESTRRTQTVLSVVRTDLRADLVYALNSSRKVEACGRAYYRGAGGSLSDGATYGSIGVIWVGTNLDGCLGDNHVLAHEVGHNLGLDHNIENRSLVPFRDNGRGFKGWNVSGRYYGTVMASWGGNYGRFSTHPEHHDGLPMGDENANAAEALMYTIEDASNYSPTRVPDPAPEHECAEGPTRSCMQKGRFLVEARVSWVDGAGTPVNDAPARVEDVGLGDTSSLFHFFDRSNPELLVKVLDGCGVNGKYWVFGSAATDLDYSVLVTDNATGVTLPYRRNGANPLINDAEAFPCWP